MMTAYGTIDLAVQAIKNGAYDFITKPFEHDKLVHLLEKALETQQAGPGKSVAPKEDQRAGTLSGNGGREPKNAQSF